MTELDEGKGQYLSPRLRFRGKHAFGVKRAFYASDKTLLMGMLQIYVNGDFPDKEVEEIKKLLLKGLQEEKIESQQNSHD